VWHHAVSKLKLRNFIRFWSPEVKIALALNAPAPAERSWTGWGNVGPYFWTNSKVPPRSKAKDPGPWRVYTCMMDMLWYRGCGLWEFAHNGVAPSLHLERARERTQLRTRHPHTLDDMGAETGWNPGWCCARLRTTTHPGLLPPMGGLKYCSFKTERKERPVG
jgi:hypothetical protein